MRNRRKFEVTFVLGMFLLILLNVVACDDKKVPQPTSSSGGSGGGNGAGGTKLPPAGYPNGAPGFTPNLGTNPNGSKVPPMPVVPNPPGVPVVPVPGVPASPSTPSASAPFQVVPMYEKSAALIAMLYKKVGCDVAKNMTLLFALVPELTISLQNHEYANMEPSAIEASFKNRKLDIGSHFQPQVYKSLARMGPGYFATKYMNDVLFHVCQYEFDQVKEFAEAYKGEVGRRLRGQLLGDHPEARYPEKADEVAGAHCIDSYPRNSLLPNFIAKPDFGAIVNHALVNTNGHRFSFIYCVKTLMDKFDQKASWPVTGASQSIESDAQAWFEHYFKNQSFKQLNVVY